MESKSLPMDRAERFLVWLVAVCFCISTWVHWIGPGLKRLVLWMAGV